LNPHGTENEAEIAQALEATGGPVGHIGRQASELQVSNHLKRRRKSKIIFLTVKNINEVLLLVKKYLKRSPRNFIVLVQPICAGHIHLRPLK
jgi:hypothetical protein